MRVLLSSAEEAAIVAVAAAAIYWGSIGAIKGTKFVAHKAHAGIVHVFHKKPHTK